jgi:hypothetical protein
MNGLPRPQRSILAEDELKSAGALLFMLDRSDTDGFCEVLMQSIYGLIILRRLDVCWQAEGSLISGIYGAITNQQLSNNLTTGVSIENLYIRKPQELKRFIEYMCLRGGKVSNAPSHF